jgi:Metallo-peptidase family M12
VGLLAAPTYTARVAVETDFEFYSLFNNVTAAATYVANLLGYSSTIYGAEINTGLAVQSISLWTTSGDPWSQSNTACGLLEFGSYWNANRTNVSRTIAHFMSGKANGGGIAWLGVLCSGSFNTSQAQLGVSCPGLAASGSFGGGYGYTGNLSGQFNPNLPTVVWDIYAVSHEIGHNFNSPHSHCYGNLGGDPNPIDQCYAGECGNAGCNCNPAALPGPTGAGSGTIMSYCHLRPGNYSNISLNFGSNHSFGVQPAREAQRMSSYVTSVAAGNMSCLSNTVFNNGFETGSTSLWQ